MESSRTARDHPPRVPGEVLLPRVPLAGLTGLGAAYLIASGVISTAASGYLSIGVVARSFLPAGIAFSALVFLLIIRSEDLRIPLPTLRMAIWGGGAGIIAVPVTFALVALGSGFSMTHILIGVLVIAGASASYTLALLRQDAWGLATLLTVLPFVSFLEATGVVPRGGFVGPFVVSPSLVLLWGAFLVTILNHVVHRDIPRPPGAAWLVLGFAGWLFLAALASADPLRSFRDVNLDVFGGILFFFLGWLAIRSQKDVLLLVVGLVIFGVLRVSTAYYLFAGSNELTDLVRGTTSNLIASHSGVLGYVAQFTLALAVGLMLYRRRAVVALILSAVIAWMVLAMLLTGLRSSVLPIALTLPILLFFPAVRRWASLLLLPLGLGIAVYSLTFSPVLWDRFARWSTPQDVAVDQAVRLDLWQAALGMTLDNPFLGVGPGMMGEYYPIYANRTFFLGPAKQASIASPHNVPLHYSSQAGIPSLLLLLVVYVFSVNRAILALEKQDQHKGEKAMNSIVLGVVWSVLVVATSGIIGGAAHVPLLWLGAGNPIGLISIEPGFLFWFTLGILWALAPLTPLNSEQTE